MGVLSNSLILFGSVLLLHAVYSAHEHSLLPSTSSPTSATPTIDLPLDITLETIASTLLLCIGVVFSSPELKPIQWRVWAGKMEREKAAKNAPLSADGLGPRGNPYQALEERPGFLDIRAKREEFADWVKEGAK